MGLPAMSMMGTSMGMPLAAPMGFPGAMGLSAQAAGMVAPPATVMSQMAPQGQLTLTPQQAALIQALAAQMASSQAANASSAAGAQAAGASTSDPQLESLLQKCEELKRLKELKQKMESNGAK
jgi:hypothetical protein